MTPDMLAEVSKELAERTSHQATVVDNLEAEVVDVATEGTQHWMSVRFTGTLREDGAMLAKPFDETWKPRQAGQRLVGVDARRHPAGA
jgi:hypothetical protein